MKNNITAGLLIIGDEVLSGRTKDSNMHTIANACTSWGIDLQEVRVIGDIESEIIQAVNDLRKRYTYIFTTGGIGGTHDDITAESIAKAFGRAYVCNEEAAQIIKHYYEEKITETRMKMAYMPENVELIENPVSKVPSFCIENVFVLAGMPSVMKGMLLSVEKKIIKGDKKFTNTITSSALEGVIGADLSDIQKKYDDVSIGSYPFYEPPNIGSSIVLRSRNEQSLKSASKEVYDLLLQHDSCPTLELEKKF